MKIAIFIGIRGLNKAISDSERSGLALQAAVVAEGEGLMQKSYSGEGDCSMG